LAYVFHGVDIRLTLFFPFLKMCCSFE